VLNDTLEGEIVIVPLAAVLDTETAALPQLKPEHAAFIVPLPIAVARLAAINVTGEPVAGMNVPSDAGVTVHCGVTLITVPFKFLQTAVKLCIAPVLKDTAAGDTMIVPLAAPLDTVTFALALIFE
jgi:hypothetical protein